MTDETKEKKEIILLKNDKRKGPRDTSTIIKDIIESEIFPKLKGQNQIDFMINLIRLSRKNEGAWIKDLTTHKYLEECNHYGLQFDDSHYSCFDEFTKLGYLKNEKGGYVYNITTSFIEEVPRIRPSH
ncbi:MAG: hypothetical protein KBD48_00435 [Candidatus Pacebacteria bacterium]|nr:hypothetical protein [Candidatus Paceibacterota bacterium]